MNALLLAATPLGNPADASPRLAAALESADLVAAEDTRRLARLLADLGIARSGPVISYFEATETQRLPRILAALAAGGTVLLVSDAGMPAISDPGFRAVQAAIAGGYPVRCLPGPSAVTAALAVSGLPSDRFCFEGFLPRKDSERRARLAELADEPRTQVYFESPRRTAETLSEFSVAFGPARAAVVCRELTKTHEEIRRGTLAELAAWASVGPVLGEITVVVAGAPLPAQLGDASALAATVASLEAGGMGRREAIAIVAKTTGTPKRVVYDAVVRGPAAP
ncbi:MAG: 16S rRNA (cytidine(1402)-2'-O)-methyltransferase [Candidatus Nanopelagicales bacterium]